MQTTIISDTKIKNVGELMEFLKNFPPETKIHGPFEDEITVFELFHKNFGLKTLSFE